MAQSNFLPLNPIDIVLSLARRAHGPEGGNALCLIARQNNSELCSRGLTISVRNYDTRHLVYQADANGYAIS
jgi:hypothetical protein